uniref:J domain-containing protein required for chloroplast accumulation response 1 n=1 Tax=Erigeron canadensis TaxID=72917 RepID=UPI001CB958EC|nr:J domain-containing protein required for chloroplast accumulation response 1 [Erigeron canadensis]
MERLTRTANLPLMRFGRSFEKEASSSAMDTRPRNSDDVVDDDVDFDDVFGGPPTRTRYSFGGSRIKSSEESSTSSVSGLCERPVFGESYSSPRRPTSDDFYDDIFRRSDESVRSPSYSTSLPAEFSLPAKMIKGVDIPVFGSNVHTPNTSFSRYSSGQTLLSRESSSVKDSTHFAQSNEDEVEQKSKTRTTRIGSPSSEFHFSIHKWANVGVPLLMSLRGGKHPTLKGSSKVSALSMDNMQESVFPNEKLSAETADVNLPSAIGSMEVTEKETLTVKQEVKEHVVVPPAPISLVHDEIEKKGHGEAGREVEEKKSVETSKKKVEAKKTNDSKKVEANKPVIGSPKRSPKNRVKGMVKDFFKISNQDSPPKAKKNVSSRWIPSARNRTQEEVDEIISKLDTFPAANAEAIPDASKTSKLASELSAENVKVGLDASSAMPLDSKLTAENAKMNTDASSTIPLPSKVPAENVKMAPDASYMVEEQTGKINKQKYAQNRTIRKLEDINFQKDSSAASESVPYGSKASVEKIDDFLIEELPPVEDNQSKTQEESEAIMALDSKIRMWSSGRKGNIRSLLSTLQLVLWAESGWKPVALVDIIESNAVKKAYNRAMLCLHPDKLQQKGADAQKKYIAEKVFDILQEAWDHFNTLGTLL